MDGDAIDLRNILGLLRRRVWLILVVAALSLGGAGLALATLEPAFTATALILVDTSKKNLLDPDAQLSGSGSDSLRVDSEVELVKSETTLLAVARTLRLAEDEEFGPRLGLRDKLLAFLRIAEPQLPVGAEALGTVVDNLREAVSVQRRGLTFLIAVNARSARPAFAAEIANAIAEEYIQQQLASKVASTMKSRDIITAQIEKASVGVAASERAFDEFVDDNLTTIVELTGRTDIASLNGEIDAVLAARAAAAETVGLVESGLAREDWAAVAAGLQDEALASLERQRVALLQGLSGAAAGSPTAVDLRGSLLDIERQMSRAAEEAVTGLKQELTGAQSRASELREQLRSSILQSDLPAEMLTALYGLQQDAQIARSQYQSLLTRERELDTQAYLQVADSRVVSPATSPTRPSFPNPRLILALAGLGGLGLGIGLAFLVENFVGGFTSEAQAEAILKVPALASIPRQRQLRTGAGEAASVADSLIIAPLSIYSESIRRIRIGIDQAVQHRRDPEAEEKREGLVIAVSSAAPGEGKTTLALSLARAYSLAGMSTLLIDCDLRKPNVHRQLGMEPSEGLLEYLGRPKDGIELKSIMTVDSGSGAQIILGSRRADVPTDQLVAGRTFARLVSAARENFDIVVLDTPPVGPVVDGLYLAGMADAVLFVVKWSSTPQQEVRAAVASLLSARQAGTPVLVAINQQSNATAAYRGKYAGYYAEA